MLHSMLIPGNVAGVAKQFLRCVFHQLAPNGILPQLFQSNIKGLLLLDEGKSKLISSPRAYDHLLSFYFTDGSFLRTLASSLIDFNELSSIAALNMLLEVQSVFVHAREVI